MTPLSTVWVASSPSSLAPAPDVFSFSVLASIEACPRRWSLEHGTYPEVWDRTGFPQQVYLSSVSGTVLHNALQRLVERLAADAQDRSDGEVLQPGEALVRALRGMGGITQLLVTTLEVELAELSENPRLDERVAGIEDRARRLLPSWRSEFQRLIGRIDMSRAIHGSGSEAASGERRRASLGPGLYSEVWLEHLGIPLRGRVDLLDVSSEGASIADVKTGAPDDKHKEQLELYALLWSGDPIKNDQQIPVRELKILYPDREEAFGIPDAAALSALTSDLKDRIAAAAEAVESEPVLANPSQEVCRWCAVRHMCGDYWLGSGSDTHEDSTPDSGLTDVEVRLEDQIGDWRWSVELLSVGLGRRCPIPLCQRT